MVQKLRELLFQNRDTRQTVVKNTIWLSVSQMGGRLIRASVIIYAARVLGAAEYGVFSYVLGLAGFFTIFADIGVTSILTREVAKKPEEGTRYFATIFWMKIALLVFTALLVVFLAPHFSRIEAAIPLIPFVAILAMADGLREFSNAFFRAKEKMELEALVTTALNVTIAAAGFTILYFSATAGALTAAYVISAAAGAIAAMFLLRKEFASVFHSFSRELVRPVANAAVPIALIALFGSLSLNVDLVMLGWWRSAEEIGFYSAAQKIVQVLYTISIIVTSSIFPALSRLIGQGEEEKKRILTERSLGILMLIAIPMTVGGIVLASPITTLLYGNDYGPAAPALQVLLLTLLVIFPGTFFGNFIFAHDAHKRLAPIVLGVSLVNAGLNALLIPLWGILGAAIATIVAQSLYNIFMWWYSRRILRFDVIRHLGRVAIASVVMGAVAFGLNAVGTPVLIAIAVAGLAYVGALWLLREPLLQELVSVVRKRSVPAS